MSRFSEFGNHLYTGERSLPFIAKRRIWYSIAILGILLSGLILGVKGLNMSLEFTGGTEFRVPQAQNISTYEITATDAVREVSATSSAKVTKIGTNTIRVQTQELTEGQGQSVRAALAKSFEVDQKNVSVTFIGPSWGASVSRQALRALIAFVVIVGLLMAAYFRTWKMAAAALLALAHDMLVTVGIYALSGFEVSPATVIGFLTVLGYSLYDTVVVFDKVRENTDASFRNHRQTFADAANLAVNQTVVRSINTTIVAVLPIIAVLVIGFAKLGPGTLLDLTLVLMIGMTIGAFSSVFLATPLLVDFRRTDPAVEALDARVAAATAAGEHRPAPIRSAAVVAGGAGGVNTVPSSPVTGAPTTGARSQVSPGTDDMTDTTDVTEGSSEGSTTSEGQTITGRRVHKYAQQPRNLKRR